MSSHEKELALIPVVPGIPIIDQPNIAFLFNEYECSYYQENFTPDNKLFEYKKVDDNIPDNVNVTTHETIPDVYIIHEGLTAIYELRLQNNKWKLKDKRNDNEDIELQHNQTLNPLRTSLTLRRGT